MIRTHRPERAHGDSVGFRVILIRALDLYGSGKLDL